MRTRGYPASTREYAASTSCRQLRLDRRSGPDRIGCADCMIGTYMYGPIYDYRAGFCR